MSAELVPLSVNSDDNLRITFTEIGENPLSAAALAAGVDLTYSFRTFDLGETQTMTPDKRLALSQDLSRPGKTAFAPKCQYIFGDTGDVAAATLTAGVKGHLTIRYSIPNSTAWTAAQIADVLTFEAGSQRKDPAVENGQQTISQDLAAIGVVQKDQAISA